MLTATGCATRRARLVEALERSTGGCDAILLSDPNSLIYFADFVVSPFVYQGQNCRGYLLLEAGRATLFADNQARVFAEAAKVDECVAPVFYQGKASAPARETVALAALVERLAESRPRRIGIEPSTAPALAHETLRRLPGGGAECLDIEPLVRDLRRVKDPDEIETLERSMRAIGAGFRAAKAEIRPGMTERDAHRVVRDAALAELGENAILYGDFASNPPGHVARRGGPPTDRAIRRGDAFILDFSVVVRGYRGDYADTFLIDAPANAAQRDVYDACLAALAVGESMLRPGAEGRAIDAAVRAVLADRGYAGLFPSHVGHGLGLNHLEPPFVVPESSDSLQAGNVLTLEPGVYLEGVLGMRIERNYLVTPDGFEILSTHEFGLEPRG